MILLAAIASLPLGWWVGRAVAGRRAWVELVAALGLGGFVLLAAGVAGIVTMGRFPRGMEEIFVVGLAVTAVGEGAAVALALGSGRGVGWTAPRLVHLGHAFVGLAAVLGFWWAWSSVWPVAEQPLLSLFRSPQRAWLPAALAGWAIALAPLLEEAIFRGWAQPLLAEMVGRRWAFVAVAAGFTLLHADTPSALPPILAIGVATGWLRDRHDSIVPGLILHVGNNAVSVGSVLWG